MQIVGVVNDVTFNGPAAGPEPAYYLPFAQQPWSNQFVVVRTALEPAELVGAVREAVWSIDRDLPLQRIRTMDQMMANASADAQFRTFVLSSFGTVGLLLAVVGVYGVMSHAVSQRRHEIGVRSALGARPGDLMTMVLRDAAALAAGGVTTGIVAAAMVSWVAEKLLFEVRPRDATTFVSAALVVTCAALLASFFPARRAARVDPLIALRE